MERVPIKGVISYNRFIAETSISETASHSGCYVAKI